MNANAIPFFYCAFTAVVYLCSVPQYARKQDGAGAAISALLATAAFLSAWIVL